MCARSAPAQEYHWHGTRIQARRAPKKGPEIMADSNGLALQVAIRWGALRPAAGLRSFCEKEVAVMGELAFSGFTYAIRASHAFE